MALTPIPVRGKRKPRPPVATSSSRASSRNDDSHEDDGPLPSAQKSKRSLSAAIARRKTDRPRSTIESLPLEVLETILLYCRSFSLPRASHLIGAKLSGRATLFKLFFAVFHETWEHSFGKTFRRPNPAKAYDELADARLKYHTGDPELQSEILTLPWVNVEFLLEAQQVWADKFARERHYGHWMEFKSEGPGISHDSHHPAPASSQGSSSFNAKACFEADYSYALTWTREKVDSVADIYMNRAQDVHHFTHIPPRLMSGPWTEGQRRLLFWLTRAGAAGHIYPGRLPPWETRVACIRNMVVDAPEAEVLVENCLAVNRVVPGPDQEPWLFKDLPTDVAGDLVEDISKRLEWGDDTEGTREALTRTKKFLADSISTTSWRRHVSRGGNG